MNGINSECVDLIYLDPPFNTKRTYSAPIGNGAAVASFKDMWSWKDVDEAFLEDMYSKFPHLVRYIDSVRFIHGKAMAAYLTFMAQRIFEMHRILKPTGSLYLHCDPTASHYLKIILDRVFGKDNFRNEIIWFYPDTPGRPKNAFSRKHDVILRYTKGQYYTFNGDDVSVPILEASKKRYEYSRKLGGKEYLGGKHGKIPEDVWRIAAVKKNSKEGTGYPTQKPLTLLRRIIEASSNLNNTVFDPFCGCATTCVAAQQLGRKWIGIDIEEKARDLVVDRLSDDAKLFKDFIHRKDIPVRTDIKPIDLTLSKNKKEIKENLYKEQDKKCNGCDTQFDVWQFDIDHILPKARGGQDNIENLQLLCGHCNSTKGDRPMEYLMAKVRKREEAYKHVSF